MIKVNIDEYYSIDDINVDFGKLESLNILITSILNDIKLLTEENNQIGSDVRIVSSLVIDYNLSVIHVYDLSLYHTCYNDNSDIFGLLQDSIIDVLNELNINFRDVEVNKIF